MMTEPTPEAMAEEIKAAQDRSEQIRPFTERYDHYNVLKAYQVADLVHKERIREGAAPAGKKIGFTNKDLWPLYHITEPMWAHIYDTTVFYCSEKTLPFKIDKLCQPKIEPEIVFRFKTAPDPNHDPARLLQCIDWVAAGFELVQCHFPGWQFKVTDTIADAGLHGALVIGEPRKVEDLGSGLVSALADCTLTLECDGREVATGKGANVLGSPLMSLQHLLGVLARQPHAEPVRAGDIVTTGSLAPPPDISPGQTWTSKVGGIDLPVPEIILE